MEIIATTNALIINPQFTNYAYYSTIRFMLPSSSQKNIMKVISRMCSDKRGKSYHRLISIINNPIFMDIGCLLMISLLSHSC